MSFLRSPRAVLVLVLALSAALRFALVAREGQMFWPDETRYNAILRTLEIWDQGRHREAVTQILGTADHLGFKVLGLPLAWLQTRMRATPELPAYFLALFSVANILWVWLLARRMGADEREAIWAAVAMAAATSMFYWARHLMPYDMGLFWALACMYVAVKPQPGWVDSLLAGVLGFAAFATYNGTWSVVAFALTLHVVLAFPQWLGVIRRAALGLVGLVGPFFLLLFGTLTLGVYLLESYLTFAGSITQGDFNEGQIVFFDYFWQTEGVLALVWLAVLAVFGWLVPRADSDSRRRGLVWFAAVVVLTAILIVGSNVLQKFVVYGRLARQLVPFCALLTGWTAARLFRGMPPWGRWERLALAGLVGVGAWNLSVPLRQEFPWPFMRKGQEAMQAYREKHPGLDQATMASDKLRFIQTNYIWPVPEVDSATLARPHEVIRQAPHPQSWKPFLYEGFGREQRTKFAETDLTMKLLLLKD